MTCLYDNDLAAEATNHAVRIQADGIMIVPGEVHQSNVRVMYQGYLILMIQDGMVDRGE